MKVAITEKQLKSISSKLSGETDVDEQNEPESGEPKSGANAVQSGGEGYPKVTTWDEIVGSKLSRGPSNQLGNTTWADTPGEQPERGPANQLYENYVFPAMITTNGRYIIFLDEVFDVKQQHSLGNIWENIDIFKTIFKNTQSDEEGYQEIRESILNLPILENNENLKAVKQVLLEFNFFNDTWFGNVVKNSVEAVNGTINDMIKKSYDAIVQVGVDISKGQWLDILNLLSKGIVYILRKLREALNSNLGMIVDAILMAIGVGKVAQAVVWSLVVGLDTYEIISGNYDTEFYNGLPSWFKYLNFGLDTLAMITTAALVKPIRELFDGLREWIKKGGKVLDWFKKTPEAVQEIEKMTSVGGKASSVMTKAISYLKTRFPGAANFLEKIVGYLNDILKKLRKTFEPILSQNVITGAKGATAGTAVGTLNYAIDRVAQKSQANVFSDYVMNKIKF